MEKNLDDLPELSFQPLSIRLLPERNTQFSRFLTIAWIFVGLGIAIRGIRYLIRFPIWPDEAFLAANFIDAGWGDMLGTLDYHQVAPLLFVWAEYLFVKLMGFSEYSLRLLPFICGIGSIFLFLHLCRRILKGAPMLLAVAIFAVAYYPIRHGAEIKPYSIDLFIALVLTVMAVEWLRIPSRTRWLWWLAGITPIAIGISFPAVFVAGGISIGLLFRLLPGWKKKIRIISPYIVFNLALIGSFLLFYTISTGVQYESEAWLHGPDPKTEDFNYDSAWVKTFPPLDNPVRLAWWFIDTHTGNLFAYPNGGTNGGSALTLICFITGALVLIKRRRGRILIILIAPFLITFIAAALHRYPYGHNTRFNLYLAPAICLLAGLGAARLIAFIRTDRVRSMVLIVFLAILAAAGAGIVVKDLIQPYKKIEDMNSRGFARWFWTHKGQNAELACVYRDLGVEFFPRLFQWGHSARYLCNQTIYSGDHRDGPRSIQWDKISRDHPLRCVVFSVPDCYEPYASRDDETWNNWLNEMKRRYKISGYEKDEINIGEDSHHETYEIYEFVPRPYSKRISSKEIPNSKHQNPNKFQIPIL
jgi:Dolichyl-phosphate-mannose-protein mannosyltransferase